MTDHVDHVLAQWARQSPNLDVASMAVIGRLSRVSQIIRTELGRTFNAHGLDGASFDVLATLRRSEPPHRLSPAQLTQAAMVTSGAISQRLDRLETSGLVTRTPSDTDGRGVDVSLTEKGRAVIDAVLPDHIETLDRLVAGLTNAQRDALANELRELLESLGDTFELPD